MIVNQDAPISPSSSAREYSICTSNDESNERYSTEDKSLLITTSLPHVAAPRFIPLCNRQPRIPRVEDADLYPCTTQARRWRPRLPDSYIKQMDIYRIYRCCYMYNQ